MRILHAVHAYPPATGGSEEVVARLSEGLASRGHDVHVATRAHPDRSDTGPVQVHGFRPGLRGTAAYRRFAHRRDWDVVMVYHSKVWTHLALWPFDHLKAPLVYAPVEFTDLRSHSPKHRLYYRSIEPRTLQAARAVMALTRRQAVEVVHVGHVPENKVGVVPNGVDHAYWSTHTGPDPRSEAGIPDDAPLTVFAGGYWPHKQVETLVRAMPKAGDAHLVCMGPDRGTLELCKALARSLGVADRVHFHDVVPRDQVRAWMHSADLVASASDNEGFGLVYLQGLSTGTPVAGRAVGAVPDLRGAGADIAVCATREEFAEVMSDPPVPRPAGTTDIAAQYDWARIVDRVTKLYREVVR